MRPGDAVKHADDCACRECKRRRNDPVKESCDCCGKTRLCQQVVRDPSRGPQTWDPHYCVAECLNLTEGQRADKSREEYEKRRQKREDSPPLAWPCIGGPLDGKYAVPRDFHSGRYSLLSNQYTEWNSASGRSRKKVGGHPSMIFVHTSLIKPMIRGADR